MSLTQELDKYLTTLHPMLKLGDEYLKQIRYTRNPTKSKKPEKPVFIIKRKNNVNEILKPFLDHLTDNGKINSQRTIDLIKFVSTPSKTECHYTKLAESPHIETGESETASSVAVRNDDVKVKYERILPQKKRYKQTALTDYRLSMFPLKREREFVFPICSTAYSKAFNKEAITQHENICEKQSL